MPNPIQTDLDGDGRGDACDDDTDDDGVDDQHDNCWLVPNPSQELPSNLSRCDQDIDDDGQPDSTDPCPTIGGGGDQDNDGDGLGDACDDDDDDDGVWDSQDDCPRDADPEQRDDDRDGAGDVCDSHFCFMVHGPDGPADDCLDPDAPLTAYSPSSEVHVGWDIRPRLWLNRRNAPLRYRWELIDQPSCSEAQIENPAGAARLSTPFEVHYLEGEAPRFWADADGRYLLRVTVELAFPDEEYPEISRVAYVSALRARDPDGGCPSPGCSLAASPPGGSAPLALLTLLLAARVVRSTCSRARVEKSEDRRA